MEEMTQAKVGVEEDSDVPGNWADVYAYVDNGEVARVWEVKREEYNAVAVTAHNCKSGLIEPDPNFGKKFFELDPDKTTEDWAMEYAENHQDSITVAEAELS
jgi:hypothetical protein